MPFHAWETQHYYVEMLLAVNVSIPFIFEGFWGELFPFILKAGVM